MSLPKTARAAVVAEYGYPPDQINEALQSMRAFREIKPLVLPWTAC